MEKTIQITLSQLEALGFKFEKIGHNDFDLQGTFVDKNGIEVNLYNDNTFGIPYGIEGNIMELKSLRDLVLLRMLLTGEAYSNSALSALKEVVSKRTDLSHLKEVDEGQQLTEWISVKDKLPDYDLKVIVWGEAKGMNPQMGGAYPFITKRVDFSGSKHLSQYDRMLDENKFQASYVTHWMPLPKKP